MSHFVGNFWLCVWKKWVRHGKVCQTETKVRGKLVKCSSPLVKQIICKGNIRNFYPLKVFCFKSIISGIERKEKKSRMFRNIGNLGKRNLVCLGMSMMVWYGNSFSPSMGLLNCSIGLITCTGSNPLRIGTIIQFVWLLLCC